MHQLPLNLAVQLSYLSENFFLHAGVRSLIEQIIARTVTCASSLSWVVGPHRSGKSHLAIRLMDDLQRAGLLPRIFTGREFGDQIASLSIAKSYVFLIDDAEAYFSEITPGMSGPLSRLQKNAARSVPTPSC